MRVTLHRLWYPSVLEGKRADRKKLPRELSKELGDTRAGMDLLNLSSRMVKSYARRGDSRTFKI